MRKDVMEKMAALVTAAFGLVAALAWNDTIKAIFAAIFGENSTVGAMIVYAVIVTILAVFATIWIAKAAAKATK